MGYICHHAIVVTSSFEATLSDAWIKARQLFANVSPIVSSPLNGYRSFFVAPDGSKEGWDESDTLPCATCGHVWSVGETRHEYDHYLGYAAEYHYVVQSLCTKCHSIKHIKQVCRRGHELSGPNLGISSAGTRICRQCARIRDKKRHTAEFWRNRKLRKKQAAKTVVDGV